MNDSPYHLVLTDLAGNEVDYTSVVEAYVQSTARYVANINDNTAPPSSIAEAKAESFGYYMGMFSAIHALCGQDGVETFEAHVDRIVVANASLVSVLVSTYEA